MGVNGSTVLGVLASLRQRSSGGHSEADWQDRFFGIAAASVSGNAVTQLSSINQLDRRAVISC
jgi:hypothetical protein